MEGNMDIPNSPVPPQLSETVQAMVDALTKRNQDTVETQGDIKTPTGGGGANQDQLKKSASEPEQSSNRAVFTQKRLVRSMDISYFRPRRNTPKESSMAPSIEVESIPQLSRFSLLFSSDEKDVESAKAQAKSPILEPERVTKPHTGNQEQRFQRPSVTTAVMDEVGTGVRLETDIINQQRGRIDTESVPVVQPSATKEEPPVTKSTSKVLFVNRQEYSLMKELGQGGSSRVFEVYDRRRQLLAVKCVDLSCADKSVRDGYLNEINMLQQLQGSIRIIKLFDYEYNREQKRLYVLMERGDVDLATFINEKSKQGGITPEMIKYYWSEMLRAVQEIHRAGIIHSDLKPANFLLVAGQLKLIDFGIASAIPDDKTSIIKDNKCGTPSYMSPEALIDVQDLSEDGEGVRIKLGVKSDVWSLGCILYHMVYGRTPYQHIRSSMRMQAIMNPAFKIEFPPTKDKLLIDVLKCCIVRDSKQRASVEELLKHPFLTASTLLDCLNELSPSSMAKVSKVLEQYQNQRS